MPFYPIKRLFPKKEKFLLKISKKWKKYLEILFYTTVLKIMIRCHLVPEIWHLTDVIVTFHFRFFFALLPLAAQKMKIKTRMKTMPGYIIILHKCTKNHDRILYCSWDMACDRCYCYFSFWAIFCPFSPLPNSPKKWKLKKKRQQRLGISSFYTWVLQIMIRQCKIPEIWCVTDWWADRRTDRWTDRWKKVT